MKAIKKGGFLILAAFSMLLVACTDAKTQEQTVKVEGLEEFGDISIVTREEGSGTREVFAQKLGLLDETGQSGASDLITDKAQIAVNAESVMDMVSQDKNAIGFVSLGALTDTAQNVKAIEISGVEANTDTTSSGDYLLGRNFNIAYSGKLTGVAADFLSYCMSEGQKIVAENYTAVKKEAAFLSDQSKGKIKVEGSTSVAPLMERLAEEYLQINKNAEIEIGVSDSTSGLLTAMQGSCDLAMASRELKDYEKELLSVQTLARDGVAVIVNNENPVISLTAEQISDIYAGKTKVWKDINK